MVNFWRKNQLVRIDGHFTIGGVDTDPTTVTLKVQDPSGNIEIYTYAAVQITKDATGKYHKDITGDEVGWWWYQWAATGTVEAVDEDFFKVISQIPQTELLYANIADIYEAMPDVDMTRAYDAILDSLAVRASRLVDELFGRKPGSFSATTDETRYFYGSGGYEQWIDELAAAPTSVSVSEGGLASQYTLWAATDYILWPYNAALDGVPYMRMDIDRLNGTKARWSCFPRAVKVVGKFGYSVTPPAVIQEAVIIQAVRWFKRGQQAFRDVGAIAELGQLSYVKRLDPDVQTIIELPKFQRMTV